MIKYLFSMQNRIYAKNEEVYSVLNLKPIYQTVYYSDDEDNLALEEDYRPKWKKMMNLDKQLFVNLKTLLYANKEYQERKCDFSMDKRIYICSLDEFENCMMKSLSNHLQEEDDEIASLVVDIDKIDLYLNSYKSMLYSLTHYNNNQRTSRNNKEHRKQFLLATINVRENKLRDEMITLVNNLREEAKKYNATHIILTF